MTGVSSAVGPIVIALLAGLLFILPRIFPLNLKTRKGLPPGPKPELFYGNTRQLPRSHPWRYFKKLNEEYGDVVYLQMGPTPTIILGSAQAAWDLLEKRSSNYSSRPRFVMGQELLSSSKRGLMSPVNDFWRRWRKALHGSFMQKSSEAYRPIQSLESKGLMHDLLHKPKGFRKHLERYAASVIVTITYGRRVLDVDSDKVVAMNAKSMETLTTVNVPGRYMVETFPVLKHVPAFLAPWKRFVLEQRDIDQAMYLELMQDVKTKIASGTAPPSFAKDLIEKQAVHGMDEIEMAYAAATPFGAGVETSSGSLASFFLACAKFGPDFVPKAQAELDKVIGRERMPDFADLEDLPYVKAIALETLRWRPIAVLGGTAHASLQEDVYKGMVIPAGSTVIAPLWGIHLNEKDFPDANHFKPERYLEISPDYPGRVGHSSFGWGVRVCPGKFVGQASVNLNIARILWGFNVGAAKDASGTLIDVDIDAFSSGFNSQPLDFPCSITVRSAKHAEVIEADWTDAQDALKQYTW